MSNHYFRIKDLPGFEDLIARSNESIEHDDLIYITAFFNESDKTDVIVPYGAVCISTDYLVPVSYFDFASLEQVDVPTITTESRSPFGKLMYEGRFTKEDLEIITVQYNNAVTVTIIEKQRIIQKNHGSVSSTNNTIYTQNFFVSRATALEMVEAVMHGVIDADDLIFSLKDLKEKELR